MQLGKLKKVDLRSVWENEARHFTQWLAKKENLSLLGEEIGIDIAFRETEATVGRYNVDILAEEENSGRKIVIENQLEITDHDHLGKIITYASGYDAEIIIWIVRDVRDEHKQAVDWLNEHTDSKVNFFIVKIELWQIGDSPVAPKFHIVSKPNDWAKAMRNSTKGNLSDTGLLQFNFWTRFKEFATDHGTPLKLRKVFAKNYLDISYGHPKSHIALIADTRNREIRCEIYVSDSKATFKKFFEHREEIEKTIGEKLLWREMPRHKASRIVLKRKADIRDEGDWENQFRWLMENAEKFSKAFGKYAL
ncbi:MAG: DUF4268 domain-containing protein [Lentisphaerae bacterium]|nr:MAG: DUF4268 domain-containing protein [Lentisphaerota bacterium]